MELETIAHCKISPHVARQLGFYVYLYVDPRNRLPFYVGKGCRTRVLAHLKDRSEKRKNQIIAEIRREGLEPILEILVHGLSNADEALRIEAVAMELLDRTTLANQISGISRGKVGRMRLSDVISFYDAAPVEINDAVILIRINKLFRFSMSELELYEATRGIWKLGKKSENAKYAFAVYEGVVREVYQINKWHRAGTLEYYSRDLRNRDLSGRLEFEGVVAPESIRGQYKGKSVTAYFSKGLQNPVKYENVPTTAKTTRSTAN